MVVVVVTVSSLERIGSLSNLLIRYLVHLAVKTGYSPPVSLGKEAETLPGVIDVERGGGTVLTMVAGKE